MFSRILCCFTNKTKPDLPNQSSIVFPQESIVINNLDDKTINETEIENISINLYDTVSIRESYGLLTNIQWKDTIPFIPPISKGIVIKVYDGDTITIAAKLPYSGSPLYRFSVRLNGIDCPEIKGKDNDEKQCAILAKNEMTELLLQKEIELKNVQTEKYGRILADVYIKELHVNQHMVEKRLAVKYDGGTKISPKSWLNYYYKGEL